MGGSFTNPERKSLSFYAKRACKPDTSPTLSTCAPHRADLQDYFLQTNTHRPAESFHTRVSAKPEAKLSACVCLPDERMVSCVCGSTNLTPERCQCSDFMHCARIDAG
eukprot:4897373-Amphidinium_carterae.1